MTNATTVAPGASLLHAFTRFQTQCERLEESHGDLGRQLRETQVRLAEKNAELARRVEEIEGMKERLGGILESIGDAVLLVDADGGIEVSNRAANHLFEHELRLPMDLRRVPELEALLANPEPVANIDVCIRRGQRERILLVSSLTMANGTLHGKVLALKDVTEQRRLQEGAARADRLAELGNVAASVAHEIRNPLGAIEGFARLLRRDLAGDSKGTRLTEMIVAAAIQLNAVVGNLLNYTREISPSSGVCDFNAIVGEVADLLRPMAADRGVELKLTLVPGQLDATIDAVQYRQVLSNLITNAVEACPIRGDGRVEVRSWSEPNAVHLSVTDNGAGIPAAQQERIFEPFFTLKDGGIGLGLALCRRIVDGHGGSLAVCSRQGEGAAFHLRLPRRPAVTGAAEVTPETEHD